MNGITANTLLKTLEEPPGAVKFILATEAAHQLLPTIRSRCLGHTMQWPAFEQSLAWLQGQIPPATGKAPAFEPDDLRVLLAATGNRPSDALAWAQGAPPAESAQRWRALPKALMRGDASVLADGSPAQAVDALQKLCHDVWAVQVGGQPRFFGSDDLPKSQPAEAGKARLHALSSWSRELAQAARTAEHPFNAGLMLEALASRAAQALNAGRARMAQNN